MASLSELGWLVGSWHATIHGGTFEEHWMRPTDGTMQGVGKLRVKGETTFMEFLSIEQSGDQLIIWIILGSSSKGPPRTVKFRLTELTDKAVSMGASRE